MVIKFLFIIAREALRAGHLKGGVVGTLMSNMSLELALKQLGIPFVRANVGDRYVLEKMQEKGWLLGGENSGHIIILDKKHHWRWHYCFLSRIKCDGTA
ncbi:phosphoglucosamine mutase [Pasteurella multocida]|nr:phosphoglucosamine mutase [Pasteurella multocida]